MHRRLPSEVDSFEAAVSWRLISAIECIFRYHENNKESSKFACDAVLTRCMPLHECDGYKIAPIVGMIDHGYPGNTDVTCDDKDNCCAHVKDSTNDL